MSDQTPPEAVNVPLAWVEQSDPRAQWANQFTSVFQPDEFIVSIGQVTPPAIMGTEEERKMALQSIGFLPVHTIAKLALNRERLQQLIAILQENLNQHDEALRRQQT